MKSLKSNKKNIKQLDRCNLTVIKKLFIKLMCSVYRDTRVDVEEIAMKGNVPHMVISM